MDEQFYDSNNSYENPSQEIPVYTPPTPKKREKKNHAGLRICALALVFALLGGALGAGGVIWYESSRSQTGTTSKNETAMLQGIRESSVLNTVTVDTGKEMTAAEVYAANVNSTVGITTSITTNYWGFQTTSAAAGSGFILTEDGYIVTNAHVIADGQSVLVVLADARQYEAELVGFDSAEDLAVLKAVDAEDLPTAVLGDSDECWVGDTVYAIGNPLGVELRGTLTQGIISAIDRRVTMDGKAMTMLQTTAALNNGNSGGPLINEYGQVIGINTMKIGAFTDSAGVEGLGFAIPSSTVKEVAEQLISQGYVSGRPTLGLEGESLSSFDQYYYRLPAGLYITDVDRSSDAAAKGIEEGDILLSVNGTNVTTMDALNGAVYNLDVGDTVEVVIYRSGKQYRVSLTVTEDKG